MPLRVGVLQTSSYRAARSVQLQISDLIEISDRDVLVIDDIFDTGRTMNEVLFRLRQLKPTSIRSAVLLRKSGRQEVALRPDFVVFEIPDQFVVGYGLDYCDQYRNLPFVAALEPADILRDPGACSWWRIDSGPSSIPMRWHWSKCAAPCPAGVMGCACLPGRGRNSGRRTCALVKSTSCD
jgi:hypothetical protein